MRIHHVLYLFAFVSFALAIVTFLWFDVVAVRTFFAQPYKNVYTALFVIFGLILSGLGYVSRR